MNKQHSPQSNALKKKKIINFSLENNLTHSLHLPSLSQLNFESLKSPFLIFIQECCYPFFIPPSFWGSPVLGSCIHSSPTAGTLLEYNPFFERFNNHNHDVKPKDICCQSGHCDWFYEVRPITRCYRRSPFSAGWLLTLFAKPLK